MICQKFSNKIVTVSPRVTFGFYYAAAYGELQLKIYN